MRKFLTIQFVLIFSILSGTTSVGQPVQDGDPEFANAEAFLSEGNADSAIYYYELAGKIYRASAEYDKALRAFQITYHIRDSVNDSKSDYSLLLIASVYGLKNESSEAKRYYTSVLTLSESPLNIYYAHANLVACYTDLNKPDSAEYHFRRALDISSRLSDADEYLGQLYNNYARVEELRENPVSAKIYYDSAYHYWVEKSTGSEVDKALILNNIGFSWMQLEQPDSALVYLTRGREFSREHQLLRSQKLAVDNLIDFYTDYRPNRDSVIHLWNEKYALNDSIKSIQNRLEFQKLQVQFDTERIQKQNAEQQIEIEKVANQRRLLLIITLILALVGLLIYILGKRKEIRQQRDFSRINEMLKDKEIETINSVLNAQDSERRRIATELHDKLGSTLSAAKLYLNHVEEYSHQGDELPGYNKGLELLDKAVQDVRTISHSMASGVLAQFGLIPALNDLKETITGTGKLRMRVITSGVDQRLSRDVELQLYRIVQELVSNALKHSKASEIIVQLTQHDNELNLLVEDNGIGFEMRNADGGLGLRNISRRAEMLGSTLNIDSYKGRGTMVSLDIPV